MFAGVCLCVRCGVVQCSVRAMHMLFLYVHAYILHTDSCHHALKVKLIVGHHTTEVTKVEPYLSYVTGHGGLPTIVLPHCIWKWEDVGVCCYQFIEIYKLTICTLGLHDVPGLDRQLLQQFRDRCFM